MSVSGLGTCHYRRAPEPCLTRALLVTHLHPVVARTSRGQLQIAHLARGRIHERRHPVSRSVAELPRKERRTTSVSGIGGHRVQDWITSIVHRFHQFLDRQFCARGRKALTQMVQTGASGILPANPRCILRARHDHLPLPTQLTGVKMRMKRATHERERNWGLRRQKWTHTYIRKQAASPNPTTSHSRVRTNSEPDPSAPAGSALTRPPNGLLKGRPAEQHLSSRHSAPPPEAPEQAERDETSRYPMSTSPQPKPTNGYPHDKPLRMQPRHPRPDSPLPSTINGVNGNSADVKSASPGSATRFGWQFPRNRPQLPDFEPDTSSPERSSSPVHRPTSRIVGSGVPSHIPVRSPGQVPRVAIKRSADGLAFTKGHKRATTEFSGSQRCSATKDSFT